MRLLPVPYRKQHAGKGMMDKWGWILCLGIVLYRIGILLLLRSTYHPDEYYQYQEPATWLAHSLDAKDTIDNYLTWEWQFPYRIRSFSSLLTCTIGYRILHILDVKWPFAYTIWPRALHCFWTIIGDIALFSINKSIHISMDSKMSTELATYAVCFHLFSGFLTYCCCRSLSNLTEMNSWIISLALFQQLFSGKLTDRTTRRIVLAFLALLCVQTVYLRPTSLLLWMPIMAPWLWMQSHQCWREDEKFWFIRVSIWIAIVGILLDSALYQELTLTPWRFITMNVGQNIAQVFGTTPWHWPLSEGVPVNTGLYCLLVPDMLMNWRSLRTSTPILLRVWLLASLLFAVGLRIVTSHQEHRFLLPILPAVHSLLALAVVQYKQTSIGKAFFSSRWLDIMRRWIYVSVPLLFAAQLVGTIFLLQYHQHGTERALQLIVTDAMQHSIGGSQLDRIHLHVALAAPCHTFPGYGHLWPLSAKEIDYVTPQDCSLAPWERNNSTAFDAIFLSNWTSSFLEHRYDNSYVVVFDAYDSWLSELLPASSYRLWRNVSHAYLRYDYDDPHPKYRVLIYRYEDNRMNASSQINIPSL